MIDIGLIADPIKLLYTPGAVAVALAQIELPLMVLPLITALMNIDPNLRQASLALRPAAPPRRGVVRASPARISGSWHTQPGPMSPPPLRK